MVSDTESEPTRKSFIPLENNPDVMTTLVHKLGISQKLAFHDVFSIEDPELLAFSPRPSYALLLVFPCTKTYEAHRREEDRSKPDYEGSGPDEPVVWYKQTIGNACGLIGLLHCVSNGESRTFIEKGSSLDALLEQALPMKPAQRAELLMESKTLEAAHQAAAIQGDSVAPPAEASVDLHYVCFVKAPDGHLYEMDGRRKAPLDRGVLAKDEDALSEHALDLGVRAFLSRERSAGDDDLRFSLLTLAPTLD